jgi:hypothetical protein
MWTEHLFIAGGLSRPPLLVLANTIGQGLSFPGPL